MSTSAIILLVSVGLLGIARGAAWVAKRSANKARRKFREAGEEALARLVASAQQEAKETTPRGPTTRKRQS